MRQAHPACITVLPCCFLLPCLQVPTCHPLAAPLLAPCQTHCWVASWRLQAGSRGEFCACYLPCWSATAALPPAAPSVLKASCVRACRPAVTLVSHRWQRVLYTEPSRWRQLQLSAPKSGEASISGWDKTRWLANKLRLAQRVSGLAITASVIVAGILPLTEGVSFSADFTGLAVSVFQLLQPRQLMDLAIVWNSSETWPEAVLHAAARLMGLTKLQLSGKQVPQAAALTLGSLPQTVQP